MQRLLFVAGLIGWVSWVVSTKLVRSWASAIGLDGHWTLSVAPSFIAGVTVTTFAAFILAVAARRGPLSAFLCGVAAMLAFEVDQLWLPGYVFHPLNVLAGIYEAALTTMIPYRRASRGHVEHDA